MLKNERKFYEKVFNSLPLRAYLTVSPMPSASVSERPSEIFFFFNSQQAEFLKLRVHFWLLFLSMVEFYPATIRKGK